MSYSIDLRERVVKYRLGGHTIKETCEVFGVGNYAVSKWVKQYKETGDLSNKPLNRGFKKIDPEKLKAYISAHPDAYQREIAEVFGCSAEAIRKALKRLGITRKKRRSDTMNKKKNK
ncbi:MAG: transposase [Ruminococcus sp.]|nr:transposase [Ruminococcus sp.]